MDIDPQDLIERSHQAADAAANAERDRAAWLNTAVALAVALLATFTGICKVKDDNIVQAMQQAQADKIDHWAYYQARHLREDVAQATVVQLRLQAQDKPAERQPAYSEAIGHYEALAKEQAAKMAELKAQAEADQQTYDALNFHDDQFDLSDAAIAIAIALLAMTSLTRKPWLLAISLVPAGFGVLMGLAGLLGWGLHPTALVKLLS
jgi:hypothetical protein